MYAELVSDDMVPNVDPGAICAVDTGDLPTAEVAWEKEREGWASEGKPIIITEYGADTYPGLRSLVAGSPWTEEYQQEYLDMNHRVFDRIDAVVGEQVWNFADFTTTSGIMRVGGNKKGVFTSDRQPKAAAYALRRRWRWRKGSLNGKDFHRWTSSRVCHQLGRIFGVKVRPSAEPLIKSSSPQHAGTTAKVHHSTTPFPPHPLAS